MSGLVSQLVAIRPRRSIGDIEAQVTIEEAHSDELVITDHPVELGASISDHAYLKPAEVVIRCGWSNSGYGAIGNLVKNVASVLTGGSAGEDYVHTMYEKLRALQASRIPFDLVTGKRTYSNMLIAGLSVTTEPRTENALMVTATCRQIIVVETRAATLPPRENQAQPAKTGGDQNSGVKQLFGPATPTQGGAISPSAWGG